MNKPWTGFQARLLRPVGVDQIEEVDYSEHLFTHGVHLVTGQGTRTDMNQNDLHKLEKELKAELQNPPSGVDKAGLEAMLDLIQANLIKNRQGSVRRLREAPVSQDRWSEVEAEQLKTRTW